MNSIMEKRTPDNTSAKFPDLPPEMREQIWKASIHPRIVGFPRLDDDSKGGSLPIPRCTEMGNGSAANLNPSG
jgi:hypothetical protein